MRDLWPSLLVAEWTPTRDTLQLWTQIVGKIRLVQTPWVNHSWHVTFYVTSRGLTTSPIPYGPRTFQIDFDFLDHRLSITTDDGAAETLKLESKSVADFYAELMARLNAAPVVRCDQPAFVFLGLSMAGWNALASAALAAVWAMSFEAPRARPIR